MMPTTPPSFRQGSFQQGSFRQGPGRAAGPARGLAATQTVCMALVLALAALALRIASVW